MGGPFLASKTLAYVRGKVVMAAAALVECSVEDRDVNWLWLVKAVQTWRAHPSHLRRAAGARRVKPLVLCAEKEFGFSG